MIVTALQGFDGYEKIEVPFAMQTDPPRGQIKTNLPIGETVVALDGYVLRWSSASLAQVRAVRLHFRTYGGHTAFDWNAPPLDIPATMWLYGSVPSFSGSEPYQIQVDLIPFRY